MIILDFSILDDFPLEPIALPIAPNTQRSHSTQRSLELSDRAKHRQAWAFLRQVIHLP